MAFQGDLGVRVLPDENDRLLQVRDVLFPDVGLVEVEVDTKGHAIDHLPGRERSRGLRRKRRRRGRGRGRSLGPAVHRDGCRLIDGPTGPGSGQHVLGGFGGAHLLGAARSDVSHTLIDLRRLHVLQRPLQCRALSGVNRRRVRRKIRSRRLTRLRLGKDRIGGLVRLVDKRRSIFPGLDRLVMRIILFRLGDGKFLGSASPRAQILRLGDLARDGIELVRLTIGQLTGAGAAGHQEHREEQRQEKDKIPVPHFAPPSATWSAWAEYVFDCCVKTSAALLSPSSASRTAFSRYASPA